MAPVATALSETALPRIGKREAERGTPACARGAGAKSCRRVAGADRARAQARVRGAARPPAAPVPDGARGELNGAARPIHKRDTRLTMVSKNDNLACVEPFVRADGGDGALEAASVLKCARGEDDRWRAQGYPRPVDYASANVFSKALHCWITPLLRRGKAGALDVDSALPLLSPCDRVAALVASLARFYRLERDDGAPAAPAGEDAFGRALLRAHAPAMALHAAWAVAEMAFRLSTPYALLKFVGWLRDWDDGDRAVHEADGWKWAALVCALSSCLALSHHVFFWCVRRR